MHLDREILSAYLDGEVEPPWGREIAEHLAGCDSCRSRIARMEEVRGALRTDRFDEDFQAPMERVRRRLLAQSVRRPIFVPLWKRHLSVPAPLAAGVALVILFLAISLSVALRRYNIGMVRITKPPAGGTEIQIAAPIGNLESLLKSIDSQDSNQDVITLPKDYHLIPVGEPLMGREAEFLRKKTW